MARNASANAFHLFGQGRTIPYGVLMTSKASNHQYDLGVKCQINSTSVIRLEYNLDVMRGFKTNHGLQL